MASAYNVSVELSMVDNVSKQLNNIRSSIDKVIGTVQIYNTEIEKLTTSFDMLNSSVGTAIDKLNGTKVAMKTSGVKQTSDTLRSAYQNQNTLNSSVTKGTKELQRFNAEGAKLKNTTKNVNALSDAQGKLNYKVGQGANMMTSLRGSLGSIAGAYLGIETVKTALDWSDQLTLTEGKLAQLTNDVEGFMDKVYQMSQDTRTSYMDNASQMAKMWQLTGGTDGIFGTEDKLIQFNELLNKGFILGGSGTREINASLYQLTQALSSGTLKGDELRSLAENAPYLINTVTESIEQMYNAGKDQSEWITLTANDLKTLGAEGVLTSDLIVDAVLSSADKIRDAYEDITPTWEQTFTKLKNQVQKVSQPILRTINDLINSEAFEKTTQSIVKMFAVVMAFLNPILQGVMKIGEFISDNWSIVEPIIWGIVGALAAYLTYLGLAKAYNLLYAASQGVVAAFTGVHNAALIENTKYMAVYNGLAPIGTAVSRALAGAKALLAGEGIAAAMATAGLAGSLVLLIGVVLAVIGVIYGVVWAYNQWTGSTVSATGIIIGAFYALYAYVYNVIAKMWNEIVAFAELIANIFNDPVYTLKKLMGDGAIAILDIWIKMNKGMISIVNSVKDTINGLLVHVNNGINSIINAYNSTLGRVFGTIGQANFQLTTDPWEDTVDKLEGWKADITAWIGEPNKDPLDYDKYKMEEKSIDEYYQKGYDQGAKWESDIADFFDTDKYLNDLGAEFNPDDYMSNIPGAEEYLNSIPNYDTPDVGSSGDLSDEVKNAIDKIKGNTDDIADMGREELKYLKDIAEQKVINRFTTATIKVTNNMKNNISSDRDIDGMADYFAEVIEKACETTAERVNKG